MTELTVNNADEDKYGVQTSHWYLIHTKPQQELRALQNLERQGYVCFYPKLTTEKLKRGALAFDVTTHQYRQRLIRDAGERVQPVAGLQREACIHYDQYINVHAAHHVNGEVFN